MRDPRDVIAKPVVTEKTSAQMENGVYSFVVDRKANKIEIARAVEALWDVRVLDVRTMRYVGKMRRSLLGQMNRSWNLGRRASFKKAVVRLAEDDRIELYEMG